jgi:phage shock protein A
VFKRIYNFLKGNLSLFVSNLEKDNPDVLIEQIEQKISKIKSKVINDLVVAKTSAKLIVLEKEKIRRELNEIKEKIQYAITNKDKTLLADLLMREDKTTKLLDRCVQNANKASEQIEKINSDYDIFESSMKNKLNDLRISKANIRLSKLKTAMNMNYSLDLDVSSDFEKLENIIDYNTLKSETIEEMADNKVQSIDYNIIRKEAMQRAEDLIDGKQN